MTVLTCDKCQTQFKVPTEKIGAGRKVRCTNCGHIWFQEGTESEAPPSEMKEVFGPAEDVSKTETIETVPDSIKPESKDQSTALLAEDEETRKEASFTGLVVFASLILVTLIFMLLAQNTVLKIWPQSAALYQAVGITPEYPWDGLKLSDGYTMIRQTKTGENILYVEVEVLNISETPKTIPPIDVMLTDTETGAVIQHWQPASESVEVLPGKAYIIKLGFTDVIQEQGNVSVSFSQRD